MLGNDSNIEKELLEHIEDCPVCGRSIIQNMYKDLEDCQYNTKGLWNLNECMDCHSAYLNPRYNQQSIINAYNTYHTHETKQEKKEGGSNLMPSLKKSIISNYIKCRYLGTLSIKGLLSLWLLLFIPSVRNAVNNQYRNMPILKRGYRLLDVGFGNGEFLDIAKSLGWDTYGIDIDDKVVKNASLRGHDVIKVQIDSWKTNKKFDYITLSHVIEHVHDPSAIISAAYRLLTPNGKLWIETPNINSCSHIKHGRKWRGLEAPRHLVLFNHTSLSNLLIKNGFKKVSIKKRNNLKVFEWMDWQSTADDSDVNIKIKSRLTIIKKTLLVIKVFLNLRRSEFITVVASK